MELLKDDASTKFDVDCRFNEGDFDDDNDTAILFWWRYHSFYMKMVLNDHLTVLWSVPTA